MAALKWHDRPFLADPIALVAFEGWGDAGESASGAVATFLKNSDSHLLASMDPDAHFDFQVRRPMVEVDSAGTRSISWPENEIHLIRGSERDVVVVLGEEPNYRWKAFISEIVEALQSLGVRRAVTLGAFIGQVAHTLPVPLVGSASRPDTLTLHGLMPSGYEGPTGIVGVLNHALSSAGIDVISVWAAVPHYLSNQEYPPATEALAVKASELLGVTVDIGDLTHAARSFISTVDEALEDNDELLRYVSQLEEDAEADLDRTDQLVEEIEDFLRDQ